MRHGIKFRKLGRGPVQRHSMLRRLATALVKHERIVTTLARAKELRRVGDRVVTIAKRDGPESYSILQSWITEKSLMPKLQGTLVERYKDRPGGYTRVFKIPNRKGDNAEMAIIEYVENGLPPLPHPKAEKEFERLRLKMTARNVIHGVEQVDIPLEGTPV